MSELSTTPTSPAALRNHLDRDEWRAFCADPRPLTSERRAEILAQLAQQRRARGAR